MVKRYSQSSPFLSPEVKQPSRNLSGPRDWTESFESIRSAMDKAGTDLQEVRVRIHDVDDQISALQPTVPAPYYPQATTLDATVDVDAGSASHARIRLSYRVSNAWWRPVYDARLDTRKGALELVRRAEVRQSSGEDWKDASLSVSTTRTSGRTAPPSINSLVVNLVEPRPALAMAEMSARSVQGRTPVYAEYSRESLPIPSTMADGSAQKLFGPATPKVMVAATEASASVDFGNFSASFVIPGKISVSGDGAPRSFRIGSKTTAPDLIVKTVPSVAATAYLQAHAVNGDDAPLLPGPVNLFRDGTYAGKGAIQQVGPGEPYDIGFGVDDSVKVTRVPVVVSKSDPNWYSRSNADVRDFKTTVKNLHSIPVKIVVNDRIPVAGHDDIKIETLEQSTPATEKDVDGKTGVLGWTYDLAAGASKEIRLAYKVSWPSGRAIDMTR
jgi:uncharacterized protein (TIGR02231 family)